MFVIILIHLLGLAGFLIHYFMTKPKTWGRIVELFLVYQLVFSVGIVSFISFIGLSFMSEMVAKIDNWPTCPFEIELGNVNLAFAVLGILCIWLRGHFWTATIVGLSIWLFADAWGHIQEMIVNHNYSAGNAGVPLFTDIIVPIILLIALGLYLRFFKTETYEIQ